MLQLIYCTFGGYYIYKCYYIVVFNYHVLFTFVMNESMKLCVSESLLWKQENV